MSDTLPPLPESDYLLALPDQPYDPGYVTGESGYTSDQMRSYAAAALAAAVAEPVAYLHTRPTGEQHAFLPSETAPDCPRCIPLYAAPPQREPLTGGPLEQLCESLGLELYQIRAIERAHGIKEQA